MAITTLQVTISGKTRISATKQYARWITFQNNAAAVMRVGDVNTSSSQGISIASGGSNFTPPLGDVSSLSDLSQWYVVGTDTQVLDVVYDSVATP
jgi:hypothetical protein